MEEINKQNEEMNIPVFYDKCETDCEGFTAFLNAENEDLGTEYEILPQKYKKDVYYFTFNQYPDGLMFERNEANSVIGFVYSDLKNHVNHETVGTILTENQNIQEFYSMAEYKKRKDQLKLYGFIPLKNGKKILVCKKQKDYIEIGCLIAAILLTFMFYCRR